MKKKLLIVYNTWSLFSSDIYC